MIVPSPTSPTSSHHVQVLERLQPSTLRVLRLVCRGWEAAASRLLCHLRPETVVGKQLGRRFLALHSLDLSNCLMGVDFASPRMLRLQVRPATNLPALPACAALLHLLRVSSLIPHIFPLSSLRAFFLPPRAVADDG
jgi:hypothetical protein